MYHLIAIIICCAIIPAFAINKDELRRFKRPCRYIFTHFGYTFGQSHFLVLTIDFDLKPHGKPIPVDFRAQKGVF